MSSSDLSRRRFLTRLGQLGVLSSPLYLASRAAAQAPAPPTNVRITTGTTTGGGTDTGGSGGSTTGRRLLTPADFTLAGGFTIPSVSGATAPDWGKGLAFRRVNNEPHLILSSWQNGSPEFVYEIKVPATLGGTASLYKSWGDIFGGKKTLNSDGSVPELFGLYWDDVDERLYWSYCSTYTSFTGDQLCLGYSTLGTSATANGPWSINGTGKRANMGVLGIPSDFATQYLGGKRLGVGFGGYQSVATAGNVSMGPALHAIDPPNVAAKSTLAQKTLVSYPFVAAPASGYGRCQRDNNLQQTFDQWPNNYFTWTDEIWQGGVWVQTNSIEGVAFIGRISHGKCWYSGSDRHSTSSDQEVFIYDRADLARVASGAAAPYSIQPKSNAVLPLPTNSTPNGDMPWAIPVGTVWDPVDSRVYVWVRGMKIYVFDIG